MSSKSTLAICALLLGLVAVVNRCSHPMIRKDHSQEAAKLKPTYSDQKIFKN